MDSSEDLTHEDMKIFENALKQSFGHISNFKGKDAWCLVGKTGSGKSTTTNFLNGVKLVMKGIKTDEQGASKEIDNDEEDIEDDDANTRYVVKVANDISDNAKKIEAQIGFGMSSHTLYPCLHGDFLDTPGFNDNRKGFYPAIVDISNRFALQTLKVNGIICLVEYQSLNISRGESFRDIIDTLTSLIIKPDLIAESLCLFITKVSPELINSKVIMPSHKKIVTAIRAIRDSYPKDSKKLQDLINRQIFDIFLENDGKNIYLINSEDILNPQKGVELGSQVRSVLKQVPKESLRRDMDDSFKTFRQNMVKYTQDIVSKYAEKKEIKHQNEAEIAKKKTLMEKSESLSKQLEDEKKFSIPNIQELREDNQKQYQIKKDSCETQIWQNKTRLERSIKDMQEKKQKVFDLLHSNRLVLHDSRTGYIPKAFMIRNEIILTYDGRPFISAETSADGGEVNKVITKDPSNGKFVVEFYGSTKYACSPKIEIFIYEKDSQSAFNESSSINRELISLEFEIKNIENQLAILEQQLKEIKDAYTNQENEIDKSSNLKKLKEESIQRLEVEIQTTKSNILQSEDLISKNQFTYVEKTSILNQYVDIAQTILQIVTALDLQDSLYDNLKSFVREFCIKKINT